MDVEFIRTGERRYAVEVRRPDRPAMRAEPAPAYASVSRGSPATSAR